MVNIWLGEGRRNRTKARDQRALKRSGYPLLTILLGILTQGQINIRLQEIREFIVRVVYPLLTILLGILTQGNINIRLQEIREFEGRVVYPLSTILLGILTQGQINIRVQEIREFKGRVLKPLNHHKDMGRLYSLMLCWFPFIKIFIL